MTVILFMMQMTLLRLCLRSALFYWRSHLSVFLGTALACAVLAGAMLVGDSVKYSLSRNALLRLGNIHFALNSSDRFFRENLSVRLESESALRVVPVLVMRGVALYRKGNAGDEMQVNNVQIIGVDERFWTLAGTVQPATLSDDALAVNRKLATKLGVSTGSEISIRVGKPSLLPRDAPLSSRKSDETVRGTFELSGIVDDSQLGRFSLYANQVDPYNVFVSLKWLQKYFSLEERANLLLAAGSSTFTVDQLNACVKKVWSIEDIGLGIRELPERKLLQMESDRIFIDSMITHEALKIDQSVGSLTYLVNSIYRKSSNGLLETPYSFVEALTPSASRSMGVVPDGMRDDEIILNKWMADCLSAKPGDDVSISYYELTPFNKFAEKTADFKVRAILEMREVAGELDLAPRFPGLTDADRCTEWDIGMPMDKSKMEDKANETYWKAYRGTPKAYVTLQAGQKMWSNRFGNLTAARYSTQRYGKQQILDILRNKIDPLGAGLTFLPVRESALKAVNEAMDFGQLFIGMSFFLVVSSLMLTGLLFAFGIQQRSEEVGILLAAGFTPLTVRKILVMESCIIAGAGTASGTLLATFYTRGLIWALSSYWQGAVAHSAIYFHAEPVTLLTGAIISFVCAMLSLLISIRRCTGRTVRDLLSGDTGEDMLVPGSKVKGQWPWIIASVLGMILAACVILYSISKGMNSAAESFFIAGILLLLSFLSLARQALVKCSSSKGTLSLNGLAVRNTGRRRSRSLAVISLLACGCFMVFAVSSMQVDVSADADKRWSGTGGFSLFGESTIPIQADLNSDEGRKKFRLDRDGLLKDVEIVSLKVRDGDDASCLNLNRAQSPRLLGVDAGDFLKRSAFLPDDKTDKIWTMLDAALPGGVIPGIVGDSDTAMWGLKKKTGEEGDILVYKDERGYPFKVKLIGKLPMRLSVFQGTVIVSASSFSAKYPSESGYRMFLVDAPYKSIENVDAVLSANLGKYGIDFVNSVDRLKDFYAVESTYMSMFLVLGGMGLLLGSIGVMVVVMRNILERRGELALFEAVGYNRRDRDKVILLEHGIIAFAGLAIGIISSLTAMWPSFQSQENNLPVMTMVFLMAAIVLLQFFWIVVAVRVAMHTSLLASLRNE